MPMPAQHSESFDTTRFAPLMHPWEVMLTGKKLAVAVSGGADSMALCLLLAKWCGNHQATLTALIVDHAIRAESAIEAGQVADWLRAKHITSVILHPSTPITAPALQEKARDARYAAFEAWCREQGVSYLCTAHHADDQLETVLMHLVRGSGLEGLAGIPPHTKRGSLNILRPLLAIEKSALQDYLRTQNQPWIEDPTNHSDHFARNRMRNITSTLKSEGLTPQRLTETTRILRQATTALEHHATQFLDAHFVRSPAGYGQMPLSSWQGIDSEAAFRAFRHIIAHVRPDTPFPRAEAMQPMVQALTQGTLIKPATLSGILFYPTPNKNLLWLTREPAKLPEDKTISSYKTITWDDRYAVRLSNEWQGRVTLGALRADGVAALPPVWRKKCRDMGVPKQVIYGFPALRGVEGLLGVPHIGYWAVTGLAETVQIEVLQRKHLADAAAD